MLFCGIDPGIHGAICVIDERCNVTLLAGMPILNGRVDGLALLKLLKGAGRISVALIEQPVPFSGVASKQSMLTFGEHFGVARCALACVQPTVLLQLRPADWKKAMGLSKDKARSIEAAQARFPDIDLLPTPRCRNPSHDRAEAALLAYFALHADEYAIPPRKKPACSPKKRLLK